MNKFNASFLMLTAALSLYMLPLSAQDRELTLEEVVALAQKQSPEALQAATRLNNRYWQYRTFKSDYLPQLSLSGNLPEYSRSIDPIDQPDGVRIFRERSLAAGSLNLGLSQGIEYTGGSITVGSFVQRIDNFLPESSTNFLGNPFVRLNQPILRYNRLRWNSRIEPLRYTEARRQYNEDMEEVARQAAGLYFGLLLAQMQLDISQNNLANNDTLYKIAQGRFELGKIAENELLQLELSLIRASQEVEQARLNMENGTLSLKIYLGLTDTDLIRVSEPVYVPDFEVDDINASREANENRQRVVGFQRQRLEAAQQVAQAKGETGFQADLNASIGIAGSAPVANEVFLNPQNQQRVNLSFTMPILDWGRTKSRVKTAEAQRDQILTTVEQEEKNFNQEIYLTVRQFNMTRSQLKIAARADEIAQRRYEITKNRYVIGKIGITDLNIAQNEKDQARNSYIAALGTFWNNYYNLRRLTLYDFEHKAKIEYASGLGH